VGEKGIEVHLCPWKTATGLDEWNKVPEKPDEGYVTGNPQ
jgi:hypothetical protein